MRLEIFLLVFALDIAQGQFNRRPQNNRNSQNIAAIENRLSAILRPSIRNGVPPVTTAPGSNTCLTPTGETGLCGPVSMCPNYLPLLRQINDGNTLTFLRGRICRILPRSLHLCCPMTSFPTATFPTTAFPTSFPTSFPATTEGTGAGIVPSGSVPIPNEIECGLPSAEKVVGGAEANIGAWPWVTAIGIPIENNGFRIICGGSLITRRHVLTAAHCFTPSLPPDQRSTHVRVGEHNLISSMDGVRPQDIRISTSRSVGYDDVTKANDIELVILGEDAIFNDFVKPVCLPMAPTLRNNLFENQTATVVGWGRFSIETERLSDVLMEGDVPIVPLGPCSEIYRTRAENPPLVDQRNICAGRGQTDACSGDSGGPLNYNNPANDRYYVIGIVSHGPRQCGLAEIPGVYTRVGAFINWIVTSIRNTVV